MGKKKTFFKQSAAQEDLNLAEQLPYTLSLEDAKDLGLSLSM